jgi:hypothetical protein
LKHAGERHEYIRSKFQRIAKCHQAYSKQRKALKHNLQEKKDNETKTDYQNAKRTTLAPQKKLPGLQRKTTRAS